MTAARQMSTFHTRSSGDLAPLCCCMIWGQKVLAGGGLVGQNPLILKTRIRHRLRDAKASIEGSLGELISSNVQCLNNRPYHFVTIASTS